MRNIQSRAEPAALLILALVYFFDGSGLFAALLPAVLVHELGHCLLLWLGGMRIRRFTLGCFGLEIDYIGVLRGMTGACAVLAGPLFGFVYALALSAAKTEFWRVSAAASFLLSAFNLLPLLPLDGGRLLLLAAGERAKRISQGMSLVFALVGLAAWLLRGWFSAFAVFLYLAVYNHKAKE